MLNKYNVILIDDDLDILESYQDLLVKEDFQVMGYSDPQDPLLDIPINWRGVVLCDVLLPNISGLTILENLVKLDEQLPVIMITGHGDVPMAVEAVKKGATNFLEKPLSPEKLLIQVKQALTKRNEIINKREWQQKILNDQFIGHSDWIISLKNQLQQLANSTVPVFLWGESGTGRHLAAQNLHNLSEKNLEPLVILDCNTQHIEQIETVIQQATKGTLVIKDVHLLNLEHQKYLAYTSQNDKDNYRLILISDRTLESLIAQQQIIPELYYLFIYTQIELLPLAKHAKDISDIFIYYVDQTCKKLNKSCISPDKKLLTKLVSKPWLGNVKELINVAELYAIGFLNLPISSVETTLFNTSTISLDSQIEFHEKQIIENALVFFQGRINEVANYLDIPRKKLYLRMRKYGFDKKSYKRG